MDIFINYYIMYMVIDSPMVELLVKCIPVILPLNQLLYHNCSVKVKDSYNIIVFNYHSI